MQNTDENAKGTGARPKTRKNFEEFYLEPEGRTSRESLTIQQEKSSQRPKRRNKKCPTGRDDDNNCDELFFSCESYFEGELPIVKPDCHGDRKESTNGARWSDHSISNRQVYYSTFYAFRYYVNVLILLIQLCMS